jgi:hypothetical protein
VGACVVLLLVVARALVGLGAGLSGRAESLQKGNSRDRKELHREALEAFLGAHICDPNDWNVLFAISLEVRSCSGVGSGGICTLLFRSTVLSSCVHDTPLLAHAHPLLLALFAFT